MTITVQAARKQPGRRSVALFPGAFRPPHVAHYFAVTELAAREDLDEVVIVITSRNRLVPGIAKVLKPEVSLRIWSVYLGSTQKVRVEIADGSAVSHAMDYFDRPDEFERLVFCLGEADFRAGDNRFDRIRRRASDTGIDATVIAAPTGHYSIRATALREAIARGNTGRMEFDQALPTHLNAEQRDTVWNICRYGLEDQLETTRQHLVAELSALGIRDSELHIVAKAAKRDPVFALISQDGNRLFVKYAKDTVKAASFDKPESTKPRSRLSAERRAIKWLRRQCIEGLVLPDVKYFNKQSKILVLGEVCPTGHSLGSLLQEADADPAVFTRIASVLASLHTSRSKTPAFWGSTIADEQHWRASLRRICAPNAVANTTAELSTSLQALCEKSTEAEKSCFVHLDLTPKNILVENSSVGIIDLERSCSFGDPAYDIGKFIAQCIPFLCTADRGSKRFSILGKFLCDYHRAVYLQKSEFAGEAASRVLAFAGASLLESPQADNRQFHLVDISAKLLLQNVSTVKEASNLLDEM